MLAITESTTAYFRKLFGRLLIMMVDDIRIALSFIFPENYDLDMI